MSRFPFQAVICRIYNCNTVPLITSLLPASPGKKTDLLIENFYLPAILIKGKTLRVLPTMYIVFHESVCSSTVEINVYS